MSRTKVLIIGATGETGGSIVNGLLEAGRFEVIALVRPKSMHKPTVAALQDRGVPIRTCDLKAAEEELMQALSGMDVLISCIGPAEQEEQIPLATAAKKVGIKRFIPCGFITVAPPGGIMWLRDEKEKVYNHVKQLRLPFTIVDVGWWYQLSYPRLGSGKIDYAMTIANDEIIGDGNTPTALTDLNDIGRYVARIIVDDRTLNKMVFVYNTVLTQNQIYDLLEEVSGETIERQHISEEHIYTRVLSARQSSETYPFDPVKFIPRYVAEYQLSWGIRGDNQPEYAKYLGYITSKELYPDFVPSDFRNYLETVTGGKAKGIYTGRIASKAQQSHFPRTESSDSLFTRGRTFPRTESSDSLFGKV